MIGRVLARLLQGLVVIWAIYTVTFLLVIMLPGNPLGNPEGRALSPVIQKALEKRYGINDNRQFYANYMRGLTRLDFGESLHYRDWTCNQIIFSSLPVSVALGTWSLLLALVFGVFFGVLLVGFAYVWKRGDLDWVRTVARDRVEPLHRPPVPRAVEPSQSILSA